jgi:thiamine biosynthesis lipoprotein
LDVFDYSFNAMGSPCSIQFFAESKQKAEAVYCLIVERIAELERRYSRYRKDSLISVINAHAGTGIRTPVDHETFALLQYAEQCYQESGRLFDITSGVLRRFWSFKSDALLPSREDIKGLLPLIGWGKVQWDAQTIYLPYAGMELDFGGIVKEYAADAAVGMCRQAGIVSGLVELGGDIRVIGPLPDGTGWPISIQDPRGADKCASEIKLAYGAVASSGDYERFQLINGVRYSHILNPKTGWPVTGMRAVSVIAEHCVVAGSVATIAMLKGSNGKKWLQSTGLPFLCCQNDGRIFNCLQVVKK